MSDDFAGFLEELVEQYGGTQKALATALGLHESAISHWKDGPPGVQHCLELARVTRTRASKILRAAGHAKVAELIEDLYGSAAIQQRPTGLTPLEEKHIREWRALPIRERKALEVIVARLVAPAKPGAKRIVKRSA